MSRLEAPTLHSRRTRGVLLAALVMALGVPSTALASNGWQQEAGIDSTKLTSVSCPSASFCVAVDNLGYALIYNGGSWSAPIDIDGANSLVSVSCPSASFCLAVDSTNNALTYNGSSWSAPAKIDSSTDRLTSVPCASASFCAAVDNGENWLAYDGGSWSAPREIDTSGYALHSVSCASASFCAAVDGAGNAYTYPESAPATTTTTNAKTTTPPPPPSPGPSAPVLGALRVVSRVVSVAGKAHGKHARRAKVIYTDVTYTDSEAATTTLTVSRSEHGVRRGHGCVAPPRHRLKRVRLKRCTRTVALGRLVMHDTAGATMILRLTKVGGHVLEPGRYTLGATASFAGLTAAPVQTSFRIP
jgi:hypothetical protein